MSKDQEADVWFEPFMVWEIRGADIQISPVYTAAKGLADDIKVKTDYFVMLRELG